MSKSIAKALWATRQTVSLTSRRGLLPSTDNGVAACFWPLVPSSTNASTVFSRPTRRTYSTKFTSPTELVPDHDSYKRISVQDLMSMKGKTTVITGGARGIGLAMAQGVVEVGGDVALLDVLDKPHQDLQEMQKAYPKQKIKLFKTDVTNLDTLTKTFDDVVTEFGHIDACLTAAGIVLDKPFFQHTWDETLKVQLVNTMGTFFTAQLAAKQFVAQGTTSGGSIVLVASIAAHHAVPAQHLSGYSCSKGAVKSLMQQLAVELAPYNIRVNSISPGYIMTDMTAGLGKQYPELLELFQTAAPLNRMGDRTDLKAGVVHLLSEAGAYTTGNDLLITGGLHLGRI
ncbi:MAG: hypothetical protein M1827_005219 [Pycnora praestabilis]|nr:MAG: hypothetical protein M1827_005219 [Pycnora praestabilis]